jgi:uncharacterized protein
MQEKKVVIAGGTGFIGQYLQDKFKALGYEVYIISRSKGSIPWHDKAAILNAVDNASMLINLAGKSVNCRYNEKNKQEILNSRTETTTALGNIILECKNPPPLWINSSTATIYRYAEDRPMTESTGEIGKGFSVEVAKAWEKAFFSFQLPNTRQAALRITIVLGKDGGVIKPMLNLVKFGLGGKQGNGRQMFSWIHIEDLWNIILFIQDHKELSGGINCGSPCPIDNKTLMQTFRRVVGVKIGLPSPEWLLKIGALIIRTETELLLKSRWVLPERLTNAGYVFKYPTIDKALTNIIKA